MKRPRLYKDRRWVEGYEAAAQVMNRMSRMEAEWRLKVYAARARSPLLSGKLSARERGFVAGLLDAFGL